MSPSGLGIVIAGGGELPISVRSVDELGVVGRDGRIKPGDFLLAVNEQSLVGVSHAEAMRLLSAAARGSEADFLTVELESFEGGLGIVLEGGRGTSENEPVRVKQVLPNGAAAEDGRIQAGMIVLAVDDVSLAGMSGERAKTLLSLAKLRNQGKTTLRLAQRSVCLRFQTPATGGSDGTDGRAAIPLTNKEGELLFPVDDLLRVCSKKGRRRSESE